MSVTVTTPVFEGPFDLLLHLILKEEVELYEVSLSTVVDAYLAELTRLEDLDLEVATEFLLIASILVELKTRRLLPGGEDLDLDEEFAAWEERDLLLARLLECKTFKDAAVILRRLSAEACRSRPRRAGPEDHFFDLTPDVLEGVTPDDLHRAFLRALEPKPVERVDTFHIAPIRVSVADAVVDLVTVLPTMGPTTFRRLTRHLDERLEIVVRFLAVLELYKQGVVEIDQVGAFGDIHVTWRADADPADVELVDAYEG
ncbi:MAG: segregation/condensation protein A [Acidimicrobiaceae bacterium]|nr:segregation/condensation protein A [Acidimicrobiaceae bacterium]